MNVLGLTAFGRGAAALIGDGSLRALATEELFSRRQGDPSLPVAAARDACAREGLALGEVDWTVFAEKPVQKFIRILAGLAQGFPFTVREFPATMFTWLGDRLWLKSALIQALGVDPDRLLFVDRNIAMTSSAFAGSPFSTAAVLVVDRDGEWATTTIARAAERDARTTLEPVAEIWHPHSLVFLVEAMAHYLMVPLEGGLRWFGALAGHGEPRYVDQVRRVVVERPGGAYALDRRYLELVRASPRFRRRAAELFGPARGFGEPLLAASGENGRRFADLARSVVEVCAERCVALAATAAERVGGDALCLGGAIFQLPQVVERVVDEAPFADVWIDPLVDDAAAAHGAARYVAHAIGIGVERRAPARAPEPAALPAAAGVDVRSGDREDVVATVAAALAAGEIVGWVDGGPERAGFTGGGRVLLVDPAAAAAVSRLQTEVKLAEPFVPLGLLTVASTAAELGVPARRRAAVAAGLARVAVPAQVATAAPGAVHADGTALVHVASDDEQPRLAAVLRAFAARTGRPPILAQTSFNRAAEPVVRLPDEALDLLRRTSVDLLAWGGSLARRVAGGSRPARSTAS